MHSCIYIDTCVHVMCVCIHSMCFLYSRFSSFTKVCLCRFSVDRVRSNFREVDPVFNKLIMANVRDPTRDRSRSRPVAYGPISQAAQIRKDKRTTRLTTRIALELQWGKRITSAPNSQVLRVGDIRIVDSKGDAIEPNATIYRRLATARNIDSTLDPWRRGTVNEGRDIKAFRARQNAGVIVGRRMPNGQIKPTKAGEDYFDHNREDFVLHIPVCRTTVSGRDHGVGGSISLCIRMWTIMVSPY